MQIVAVLRGCLAAYLTGVLIYWADYLFSNWQGTEYLFGPWMSLVLGIVYGAALAVPAVLFVMFLWWFLAWREAVVSFYLALISGAAVVGLLVASLSGSSDAILPGSLWGLICGATFWLAAFGLKKNVVLSFRW